MKKYLLCCFWILFYVSCTNVNQKENNRIEYETINIDKGITKKIRYDQTTKYICLDTAKAALFAYIDKLIIKNNRIYIMDKRAKKKILCFDMKGNHLLNYGKHGKGPGEYTSLTDFDVNNEGEVIIFNNQKKKLLCYNEQGNFVNDYSLGFYIKGFKLLTDGNFFMIINNYDHKKNSMICIFNPETNNKKFMFKYHNKDKTNYIITNYMQQFNNQFVCYIPIRDYIFVFNSSGNFEKGYKLNFGSKTLPEEYKYNTLKIQNYSSDYKYLAKTPVITENYIIGQIISHRGNDLSASIFLYNKNTRKTILTEIKQSNYSHRSLYPYLGVHDDKIVSYLNIENYEATIDKNKIPIHIKEYIEAGNYVITFNSL